MVKKCSETGQDMHLYVSKHEIKGGIKNAIKIAFVPFRIRKLFVSTCGGCRPYWK